MNDRHDLELVLDSGTPIVVIETADETRFLQLLTDLAVAQRASSYRPLFRWSVTDGLQRLDLQLEAQRHNAEPAEVLRHIRARRQARDLRATRLSSVSHASPVNVRLLKDIALAAATPRSLCF